MRCQCECLQVYWRCGLCAAILSHGGYEPYRALAGFKLTCCAGLDYEELSFTRRESGRLPRVAYRGAQRTPLDGERHRGVAGSTNEKFELAK